MRLLLGIVLAILLAPGAAHATDAYRPLNDMQLAAKYTPTARAAWPDSPCVGRESIHVYSDLYLERVGDDLERRGYADVASCQVWVRSGLDPLRFCIVLTHELGHLAGRFHTDVPGDVMNGHGDSDYGPCHPLTARDMLMMTVTEWLPAPHRDWRIDCRHPAVGVRFCRAHRAGSRTRRYRLDTLSNGYTKTDQLGYVAG